MRPHGQAQELLGTGRLAVVGIDSNGDIRCRILLASPRERYLVGEIVACRRGQLYLCTDARELRAFGERVNFFWGGR